MKKLLVAFILFYLLITTLSAQAGITKLYVGVEDNQFIFGIAGKVVNLNSGAVSFDLRRMLPKASEYRHGVQYPALPSQFKTELGITSLNQQNLYSYQLLNTRVLHQDGRQESFQSNAIEAKTGTGYYLLYE